MTLVSHLFSQVDLGCVQVYLLLDEFIMGGELQETSKKVSKLALTLCNCF